MFVNENRQEVIDFINECREDTDDMDFFGIDMGSNDFTQIEDLRGVDFSGIDLTGSTFDGVILDGANFKGAKLVNVSFEGSFLNGADFTGAIIEDTNFNNSTVANTIFNDVDFSHCTFIGTNLEEAELDEADFFACEQ